ncbi:MAG: hypothetical protein JNK05_31180 [Myxococcales bacterium]|nr:hypothetical protein [Myxococcales bacterium]
MSRSTTLLLVLTSTACATASNDATTRSIKPMGAMAAAIPAPTHDPSQIIDRPLPRPATSCATGPLPAWSAPAQLDTELARATGILVALGLPVPTGQFVSAPANIGTLFGDERNDDVQGWIVGDGVMLTIRGDLLTTRGDARPSELTLRERASEHWDGARTARARGRVRPNLLAAALLARAGHTAAANAQWRAAPRYFSAGRERSALLEFAETYFDGAVMAHRFGRDALALRMLERLDCARLYIEEHGGSVVATTSFEGGVPRMQQERSTEFLRDVPAMIEEARRRTTATASASIDPSRAPAATVEQLIEQLDRTRLDVAFDEPLDLQRDPIVRAIIARGTSATPALINAFENDRRVTRTVRARSYPFAREVFTVRRFLDFLIAETSGMAPGEFGWDSFDEDASDSRPAARANTMRLRWDQIATLSPYERALAGASDSSANFERQIRSVAWLFAARDPSAPSSRLYLSPRPPNVYDPIASTSANSPQRPQLTPPQRAALFNALRARVASLPPISDRSQRAFDSELQRCAYTQLLYLLDAPATEPLLRETIARFRERVPDEIAPACASWVSVALAALGDRAIAADMARRIRELHFRDGELGAIGEAWAAIADRAEATPVFEALARFASQVNAHRIRTDERGTIATVHSVTALSIVSENTLRSRLIRESTLGLLEDTRPSAIIWFERGSREIEYLNARGHHTFRASGPPDGPDFSEPGRDATLRMMDSVTDFIANRAKVRGAPPFDLRWTQARRDRAIDELRQMLRAMR